MSGITKEQITENFNLASVSVNDGVKIRNLSWDVDSWVVAKDGEWIDETNIGVSDVNFLTGRFELYIPLDPLVELEDITNKVLYTLPLNGIGTVQRTSTVLDDDIVNLLKILVSRKLLFDIINIIKAARDVSRFCNFTTNDAQQRIFAANLESTLETFRCRK